uniref:Membrane insertase YidC/Oxa/ALB C-terminal domain-containing protein n=1 Tax=Pseudo-nitzschia delicatissima TaxID=44447 RepID=A0A7S0T8H6_9STRA|mmetsp:Transcript_1449/g.3341  ORF Transcript_1449/g.3341 Transcript_1449/m.3341 type:complete len:424 (+) Transcript_1449:203-1474(+)
MKFSIGVLPLLLASVNAFAPTGMSPRQSTARAVIDPSNLHDLPHHIQSFQDVMSSFSIADLDSAGLPVSDIAAAAPQIAADVAEEVSKPDNGWFGFLTGPTMAFLNLIHTAFVAVGLDSNSWGVSIIALTLSIKLLTFPLTKSQLESTQKMQALQPSLKAVQAKYQSNPEVMNQKIAELYQTNEVNPLAGCIPSIVQIPVFIGLYRAVLDLANENMLDEPFLWLPSLEGPTYGSDPTKGSAWLFDNWVNGAPSLGWEQTAAFLVLPVLLVVSQFASMEFMTPKEQKDQQPAFLKVLPLMIGYFSLNVPSALCVYWVTNNLVTTATSVIIRNSLKMEPATVGGPSGSIDVESVDVVEPVAAFSPPTIREKPDGFASGGVTPITSKSSDVVDVESTSVDSGEGIAPEAPTSSKKKRGKKRKKKRN